MDEALIRQVEDIGLSEKEARIYLANLVLGPSPVQKLADYAGIKRVTAYVILESLVSLGLVSQTSQGKKTYFVAEDPSKLKNLLEKREQELIERKDEFGRLLPALQHLKMISTEAPRVQYYEGPEAIKAVVKNFLSSHRRKGSGLIYGISNVDNLFHFFPEFEVARQNPDRVNAGLRSMFLYTSKEGPILEASDSSTGRESRYLPPQEFPFKEDISISDENVVFLVLSGTKPMAIHIRSAELAAALKALFDRIWDSVA